MRVQFGLADSSSILSPLLRQECTRSYVRHSEDSSLPKQREIPAAEACDTCNSQITSFWHSASHVVSYKDRASGAEGSAEVCGLFKCGTDLIFECNEMTTVTRGAMGADLGSATA